MEQVEHQQAPALSIDDKIGGWRLELVRNVEGIQERYETLAAKLAELQNEFSALAREKRKSEQLLKNFDAFAFSATVEDEAKEVAVPSQEIFVPTVATATQGHDNGNAPRRDLTIAERLALVMGDGLWDAPSLKAALANAGDDMCQGVTNPHQYLLGALNNSTMRVPTPNGDLRDKNNKIVKVRKFTAVERGKYRISTLEDTRKEVAKLLGADDVIISETPAPETGRSKVELMFAEQGIDITAALPDSPI